MSDNIKSGKEIGMISGYILEKEQDLQDIKSCGLVYRHKKTGARVAVVSNNDENKVFIVGFRTPPKDNTGAAHIIEHTVLCGSDRFPVKDPFMELVKGSLNTFMNAMTYPDKTVYPVASCNNKDFNNLMHVYMDAVFCPQIYKHKEFFLQEGWRYTLESPEAELGLNGVVYSEMKGAFSSPEEVLYRRIQQSLYKDTSYGNESGGDPEYIIDLTYEDYLDFHRRYYHPTNSYIYLYGDMDVKERLEWLDREYLSKYDYQPVDSALREQKNYGGTFEDTYQYSINESESTEDKTYLSCNYMIGQSTDIELCMAFSILSKVLFKMQGAPVKQALVDAGICDDIMADFDDGIMQPMLTVVAKNSNLSRKKEFMDCINSVLKEQVEKGINKLSLRAAISAMEFRFREADFGRYPKGLMYGLDIFGTWLYDDNKVYDSLLRLNLYKEMYERIDSGYFEQLIDEYLLNPKHCAVVILEPKQGLVAKNESELTKKLRAYKESLSEAEIEELVQQTENLKIFQETPDSKEALATLPKLLLEDIGKEAAPISNIEKQIGDVPVVVHDYETNGISYIRLLFRLGDVPQRLLPYVGLLTRTLGSVNAGELSYQDLSNEINIKTGGIGTDATYYGTVDSPDEYMTYYLVSTKVLTDHTEDAMKLIAKIIDESDLEDGKRLRELVNETKSRMQMSMNQSGDSVAVQRVLSYISQPAYFQEAIGGVEFYRFIEDLADNFEDKYGEIKNSLKELVKYIFRKDNLIISLTSDESGFNELKDKLNILYDVLSDEKVTATKSAKYELSIKNEGLMTPGQVQFVAKCGNYMKAGYEYTGSLKVLRTILGLDYLWNMIRVKGGAYGCSCNFTGIDGLMYFSSYRDPNLTETVDAINNACEYVREFEADTDAMNNYVIGTIGTLDTPLTPSMKGQRSFSAYMTKTSMERIQKERDEILATDFEAIRKLADITEVINKSDALCVVGYENKILENKELFIETRALY